MSDKERLAREEAAEHDKAFDEAHAQNDGFSAAFHAMASIAAERKAEEIQRAEHPELERIDQVNSTLKEAVAVLTLCLWCLVGIFLLLCVVTYKLF